MIITHLKGGLGNQMFQYALGRTLSIQNNDTLKLDVFGLEKANAHGDIYRPYALDAFSIQAGLATQDEVQAMKYPLGIISKLIRKIRFTLLRQTHTGWEPEILLQKGDMYLDGYWQSPKYFENIRDALLKDFSLKEPFSDTAQKYAEQIKDCDAVAVHIRRGDYVANPKTRAVHGPCSITYYENALSYIQKHVTNPTLFVFSDDITWVKENLSLPESAVFVSDDGIADYEELVLMSMCSHNIIANSSFSWWGVWLNTHDTKIVIAPTPWFNTKKDHHADLIPDSWIQLPKN